MNTTSQLLTAQDGYLGFAERNRLTPEKRLDSINTALGIVYDMLTTSSIIKKTSTISVVSNEADPPDNFNEGTVLYIGDSSTFNSSSKIFEVNEQEFGRLDDVDENYFVQRYDDTTGDLKFVFNSLDTSTCYIEYEMGAPTLVNTTDLDGLPNWTKPATAKLSAGILTQNLLKDDSKMQVALYGPTGNKSTYTPDSVYGILMRGLKRRRKNPQRSNPMQICLTKKRR